MKLNYARNSKDPTYTIAHTIRSGKKTSTVTLEVIGKHSELLKDHPDPLAYAKQCVKEYNDKNKELSSILLNFDLSTNISEGGKLPYSTSTSLNIGYFFLQCIYQKLDLGPWFKEKSKKRKLQFDCDLINRFLTFDRILYPESKLATSHRLNSFFEKPEFAYQEILRFMDFLEEHYNSYIEHLFHKSNEVFQRDSTIIYYDCSNFYFEIEKPDEDYIDEVTGEVMSGLREYGFAKDHKPNPIVQMGLFMDKHGIPITMSITPGNTNEQTTAIPLEKQLLKMIQGNNVIYCADAGLGSYEIRNFNDKVNRSFVVTQSIKKLNDQMKQAVLNDYDYKLLSNNNPVTIKSLLAFDRKDEKNLSLYNDFAYKVIQMNNPIDVGLKETKIFKNGNQKEVKSNGNLKQYVIVTFSRKVYEYQKSILDKQVDRAEKLLETKDPDQIKKGPNDIRRFIKLADNKEVEYVIDRERERKEREFLGYYAVATNLEGTPKDILAIQKQRYKIEDCFRTLKTTLEIRPINHRLPNRIKAHFLICYTALLIIRLLQAQLDKKKIHHTEREIIETLRNLNVGSIKDVVFVANYIGSNTLNDLETIYPLDLKKQSYLYKTLKEKIKKNNS